MSESDDWDEELYQEGHSTGERWSRHSAQLGERRRLRRFYENLPDDGWDSGGDFGEEVYAIMAVIDPNSEYFREAVRENWERIVGRTDTDAWETEFVSGFVEGTLEFTPEEEWDEELHGEGYSTGERWSSTASPGVRRRLQRYYENLQDDEWDSDADFRAEVYAVMAEIDPNSVLERYAVPRNWEQIVGRTDTDVWEIEFVRGFVEGTLEFTPEDEWDEELYEEGYSTGERWSRTAPRGALRRLRRFHENLEYEWDHQRPWDAVNNAPDFPSITAVIFPNTREDLLEESRETWEEIVR